MELKPEDVDVGSSVPSVTTDRKINDKMADLNFYEAAEQKELNETPPIRKRQPPRNLGMSVSGATGVIDVPSAYTLPCKDFILTYVSESFRAGDNFWPFPYNSIREQNQYAVLRYGLADTIELSLSFENWNRQFQYLDGLGNLGPAFTENKKFFLGIGSKWAIPMTTVHETAWLALGFRAHFFENPNRAVIEFHEYERIQNLYLAFSVHPRPYLYTHFMYRYISYDFRGGVYPSGVTDDFIGFSLVNAYDQLGMAIEYDLFPNLTILTEATKDTDVIFLGGLREFNFNVGVRARYKNLTASFLAKRVNHPDLEHQMIQVGIKF